MLLRKIEQTTQLIWVGHVGVGKNCGTAALLNSLQDLGGTGRFVSSLAIRVVVDNEPFGITFWGIGKIHNNVFCYDFRHGCYIFILEIAIKICDYFAV